jgi:hypothetical protein
MRRRKQPDGSVNHRSPLLIGVVIAIALLLLLGLAVTTQLRPSEKDVASVTTLADESRQPRPHTSIADSRDEVVARLRSIFRVRDRAIQARNATILDDIYTVDCPCLKGDRALIQELKKKGLVWRGIEVSLVIENAERVNSRLWIINALVKTSPFQIERESGALVRSVPSGQERSRVALARPLGQDRWLLGQASVLAGRD